MKQDFYAFFLPTRIIDRSAAARAVAAGAVAGFLLAITSGLAAVILLYKDANDHQRAFWLLGATALVTAITVGTWRRILSAALLGLVLSVIVVTWELQRGQIAFAIVLGTPLVGGFLAAVRGIVALKKWARRTQFD
jgi:hypothetical protein